MPDPKENQEKIFKEFVESQESQDGMTQSPQISQVGPKITEISGARMPWEREAMPLGNLIGWIPLPIEDLPTRGLFYPVDTTVAIRAATGGEIRHWSTLDETDLSSLDDMINYVIERCVTIKASKESGAFLTWKDIKEVDRFYLLLAIHELTFANGENKLQVSVSDDRKVDVSKDMVSYVSLDPKIMRFYDEVERCFVLKIKNGRTIKLDLPSVGVTQWLKQYIQRKQRSQEFIDEDFLTFAPFLIRSWKGLNDDIYAKHVEDSNRWDVTIISLLVEFKKIFSEAIDPVIKFNDEGGMERTAPLNFQGGIKSIFLISDPFGQLE